MLERGLLAEAESVYLHRACWPGAAQAIGYKEFFPYFENVAPLAQCVAALKQALAALCQASAHLVPAYAGVVWLPAGEKRQSRHGRPGRNFADK